MKKLSHDIGSKKPKGKIGDQKTSSTNKNFTATKTKKKNKTKNENIQKETMMKKEI
jgi:hypothetical protein